MPTLHSSVTGLASDSTGLPVAATVFNGIKTITEADGSTHWALPPFFQQEGVRRNTRQLHDKEASFFILRSNAPAADILAAAAARSYRSDNLSQYASFPAQMTHPSTSFTLPLLQHLDALHLAHNAALGLPETTGQHTRPSGTVQLRYASWPNPPPEFDCKAQAPCADSEQVALSTEHTDRAKADQPGFFPELFKEGGALYQAGVGGCTDVATDDGSEHSSYTDTNPTMRTVVNVGKEPLCMRLSLPILDVLGVHVASSSPTGPHDKFQWHTFVLQKGDVFGFVGATGVFLKHQASASKTANGICFSVCDVAYVDGVRDVRQLTALPAEAGPWPWEDQWRVAPKSANQARGEWGGAPPYATHST